jgi:hypothetical protein
MSVAMFDTSFAVAFGMGMAVGLSIGIVAGKRQRPWSELTENERRTRIWLVAAGAFLVVAGIAAFLLY